MHTPTHKHNHTVLAPTLTYTDTCTYTFANAHTKHIQFSQTNKHISLQTYIIKNTNTNSHINKYTID